MLYKERSPGSNIVILAVIVGIALVVSIFSYQFFILASNKIVDIASQEVRSAARIEVHDISQILANKLQTVGSLLQTLAEAPAIHNNEYQRAATVINGRQRSSSDLTDFYIWLDKSGKINWISNINETTYQKYKGTDLSYRSYFTVPKDTHREYYSNLIESNDKVPRLYISYPIINTTEAGKGTTKGIFTGVVVVSIGLNTLNNFLKNQLFHTQFNSTIGLLDRNGTILYATGSQRYDVGKTVFGNKFRSTFSSLHAPEPITAIIRSSLHGNTGSEDVLINGQTNTIAYHPVTVNGKNFLTLYIIMKHSLATDVTALINQQRYFTTLIITIIGAVAIIIAFLIFSWNKRLETLVNTRTAELALANEQLKIHDKMQQEFINIASHEIKTPTQAILAYSDLIQRHPEKREDMIRAIARNASRLKRLTNDILDVTRIESQSLKLNVERVNLKNLISNIIEDNINEIKKTNKNIKLLHESKDQIIEVEADKYRLTQVVSNLLSNAIKFTKEGYISVTEEIKESEALVSIKDTGQGIDSEIFPRLFLKFAAKSETGTGLGLFISKSIVEAHGGKIWAKNNAEYEGKKGATFAFSIPLSKTRS